MREACRFLFDDDPFLRRHCLQDGTPSAVFTARVLPRILGALFFAYDGFKVNTIKKSILDFRSKKYTMLSVPYPELAVFEILFIKFIPKDIYLVLNYTCRYFVFSF